MERHRPSDTGRLEGHPPITQGGQRSASGSSSREATTPAPWCVQVVGRGSLVWPPGACLSCLYKPASPMWPHKLEGRHKWYQGHLTGPKNI